MKKSIVKDKSSKFLVMKKSIIKDKSFEFSLSIIELYKFLQIQKEFVLSKLLLRSATSIGANVNEALAGESKADFAHKMSIASKEARESLYWLELVFERKQQILGFFLFQGSSLLM